MHLSQIKPRRANDSSSATAETVGQDRWTVDAIGPAKINADKQHVDFTDLRRLPSGRTLLALAGSNRSYLVEMGGRTLFANPGRHPQGSALGRFRDDSEFQVAIYNAEGPMVLYDASGKELWQRPTPRRWPLGCPKACEGRVFHRNAPIKPLSIPRPGKPAKDYIIYSDGGWPWGMDGDGKHHPGVRSAGQFPSAGTRVAATRPRRRPRLRFRYENRRLGRRRRIGSGDLRPPLALGVSCGEVGTVRIRLDGQLRHRSSIWDASEPGHRN